MKDEACTVDFDILLVIQTAKKAHLTSHSFSLVQAILTKKALIKSFLLQIAIFRYVQKNILQILNSFKTYFNLIPIWILIQCILFTHTFYRWKWHCRSMHMKMKRKTSCFQPCIKTACLSTQKSHYNKSVTLKIPSEFQNYN